MQKLKLKPIKEGKFNKENAKEILKDNNIILKNIEIIVGSKKIDNFSYIKIPIWKTISIWENEKGDWVENNINSIK